MPELVVDPAALGQLAWPLVEVADRLGALAAALPTSPGPVGPDDLVHALEDLSHAWSAGLRALAADAADISQQLASAASAYDGVEALVSDWSRR